MALRPRTPDRQDAGADGGSAALQFRSTTIDRICELVGTHARRLPPAAGALRPPPRQGRKALPPAGQIRPMRQSRLRVFFSKPEYIFSDFIIY